MKKTVTFAAVLSLAALAACHNNNDAANTSTMNLDDNSAMMTDNYATGTGNMATDLGGSNMANQADAIAANGQNMATDLRTNDHDMNLANGM